jgi:hypothetical protein
MKTCKHCDEEFEESSLEYNPAQELGEIFLESTGESGADDRCPKCKEEMRVTNLFGFGE